MANSNFRRPILSQTSSIKYKHSSNFVVKEIWGLEAVSCWRVAVGGGEILRCVGGAGCFEIRAQEADPVGSRSVSKVGNGSLLSSDFLLATYSRFLF